MAARATIWNHRDPEHVRQFAAFLKPLARAAGTAGTRMLDDPTVAAETVQAWILSLADVPADVLDEARGRVMREGFRWMPSPGDVKRHAVDITNERIRETAAKAKALTDGCENCGGSTWRRVELEGVEHVTRCGCQAAALELMATAPKALALPKAAERDEVTA